MRAAIAIAITAIIATPELWSKEALAQKGDMVKPIRAIIRDTEFLEKYTGWQPNVVLPLDRPDATKLALPYQPAAQPPTTVLNWEPGGKIDFHTARFQKIAALGGQVKIRHMCQSACTLILYHIPKERLCFGDEAYLNFHKASNADGTVSEEWTRWMFNQYPPEIKAWLKARGGPENLKQFTMWTLEATELWKMGYRRCE